MAELIDEVARVRELRAEAPAPDRASLAPGRARLLHAAATDRRRHRVRVRPRFVIVGVAAAVTAVAVAASLLVGRDDTRGMTTPATLTDGDLKGMSAAELLERAAEAVEGRPPVAEPRAKQWIYQKWAEEAPDEEAVEHLGDRARFSESWIRYDGSAHAFEQRDPFGKLLKLHVREMQLENGAEGDDRSPREMYRCIATLPADGRGALRALREKDAIADEKGATRAQNDYSEISVLLGADIKSPEGVAGLYRAFATLPGLTVVGHLVDTAAGRRAVAVRYSDNDDGDRDTWREWLFDPETFETLGVRRVRDGKVTGGSSAVTLALVDKPGERR
ncbi:CU044_5270 family protein [Streptomyces sp. MB09-02B]|uniref:CU044_5270 family protein n=1 Tax=Streptomyces sp. MB09-02B TaxID=3028667 RepID=UPI0029B3AED1|nr:CU044_5270 family protein [Streptomyces sp. MB09-02B]MDX3639196.1 CU044_5270 family protein [Streptomyces sp. MB09-02B]